MIGQDDLPGHLLTSSYQHAHVSGLRAPVLFLYCLCKEVCLNEQTRLKKLMWHLHQVPGVTNRTRHNTIILMGAKNISTDELECKDQKEWTKKETRFKIKSHNAHNISTLLLPYFLIICSEKFQKSTFGLKIDQILCLTVCILLTSAAFFRQ